jgi:RNA polymerase sigma-70 factor (ECF subfamily)
MRCPARAARTPDTADELDELLCRIADGDRAAFSRFYRVVAVPVQNMVTRVLKDHAKAEEVVQEVFLEIWLKAGSYSSRFGSAMSWTMTMAHRRAVDRVRYERASADREGLAEQLDLRRPVDDVVEQTLARFERQEVHRALRTLTELQRESIMLAYYDGYSYREMSQALGAPVNTLKTRVRNATTRLREFLAERN